MPPPTAQIVPPLLLERLATLIYERCGISFAASRRRFLERRLWELRQAVGAADYKQLALALEGADTDQPIWVELTARITVGETQFFRYPHQMQALGTIFAPAWRNRLKTVRVLSLGCSSGEEPYTVAMVLDNHLGRTPFQVTAVDISHQAIALAKAAVYPEHALQRIRPEYRQRYFEPAEPGLWRVRQRLRQRVSFETRNLLQPHALTGLRNVDLVLCRNVLIYFRPEQVRSLLEQVHRSLNAEGLLMLGHTESMSAYRQWFTAAGPPEVRTYTRAAHQDRVGPIRSALDDPERSWGALSHQAQATSEPGRAQPTVADDEPPQPNAEPARVHPPSQPAFHADRVDLSPPNDPGSSGESSSPTIAAEPSDDAGIEQTLRRLRAELPGRIAHWFKAWVQPSLSGGLWHWPPEGPDLPPIPACEPTSIWMAHPGFARSLMDRLLLVYEALGDWDTLRVAHETGLRLCQWMDEHGWRRSYRLDPQGRAWASDPTPGVAYFAGEPLCPSLAAIRWLMRHDRRPEFEQAIDRGVRLLLQGQDPQGGWPVVYSTQTDLQAALRGRAPWGELSVSATANACRVLLLIGRLDNRLEALRAVRRAGYWLLRCDPLKQGRFSQPHETTQGTDGEGEGEDEGEVRVQPVDPLEEWRCEAMLLAAAAGGPSAPELLRRVRRRLLSRQARHEHRDVLSGAPRLWLRWRLDVAWEGMPLAEEGPQEKACWHDPGRLLRWLDQPPLTPKPGPAPDPERADPANAYRAEEALALQACRFLIDERAESRRTLGRWGHWEDTLSADRRWLRIEARPQDSSLKAPSLGKAAER